MAGATIAAGLLYISLQWSRHGSIEDAVFVGILIGATLILLLGIGWFYRFLAAKGLDYFQCLLQADGPADIYAAFSKLCASTIDLRRTTAAGCCYGALVGSAAWILNTWEGDAVLRFALGLFLFSVNFVTGVAFHGLLVFFGQAVRSGRHVPISLWHSINPATDFLLAATRRIVLLASVYISLCIGSVAFSTLPLGGFLVGYSVFCGLVLIASIFVPIVPLALRTREVKEEALRAINARLDECYREFMAKAREGDATAELAMLERYFTLKAKIEAVPVWPFKLRSIGAALSVVFFSSIPVLLQLILERLAKR